MLVERVDVVDPTERNQISVSSRMVLESSWLPLEGFCPPNQTVYPHQWLWDSCFHAIAWNALDDDRGLIELATCFRAQLPNGFVPHMRYLAPNTERGPNSTRSSYLQPPIFAHAAGAIARTGREVPAELLAKIGAALAWLWRHRLGADGLLRIVHPWESGADDSPRWDSWIGLAEYDRQAFRSHDVRFREATEFDLDDIATWSSAFVAAPAAFNAFAAHAAFELADLTADTSWRARATDLAAAIDRELWDDESGLWTDRPIVGGGPSCSIPTLDGVFGALVTADERRAMRAIEQLVDPERFGSPFGLAYLPPSHPLFRPDEYWRGTAWPQLNYMAHLAATRWGSDGVADEIAAVSLRSAHESGFAEFWNPLTGDGRGAIPQGWAALAAVYAR